MERGDTVVATYGYNDILEKPFQFLYDYGYRSQGGHVVYTHGESSMQDAHVFKEEQLRYATDEDKRELYWGH